MSFEHSNDKTSSDSLLFLIAVEGTSLDLLRVVARVPTRL